MRILNTIPVVLKKAKYSFDLDCRRHAYGQPFCAGIFQISYDVNVPRACKFGFYYELYTVVFQGAVFVNYACTILTSHEEA